MSKEKGKAVCLSMLVRLAVGACVLIAALVLVLLTHTQIIVGAIQSLSAGTVKTTNTFEPEGEPMDAVRDNGQRIITEIAYADEYPNSFLDITYPDEDTSVRRPTLVYFHGGGFFGGSKSVGDPLASSDVTSLLDDICAAGYNVVNVDYGLVPDCRFPAPVLQATWGTSPSWGPRPVPSSRASSAPSSPIPSTPLRSASNPRWEKVCIGTVPWFSNPNDCVFAYGAFGYDLYNK